MTAALPEHPTLVVFCRRPTPGVSKQRIAAELGPDLTMTLAQRLLDVALEDALVWPGPVILAPAADSDAGWAGGLLPRAIRVVSQRGGNLGARLNHVDRELRQMGSRRLIYIGTDAPLLDYGYYARARLGLTHADIVLGPAEDGGVTLMGARVPWPEIHDLPWSTPELGDALARRCRARGLTVHDLTVQYDVDDAAVLPRLARDLAPDVRPARARLRRWLAESGLAGRLDATRTGPDHHEQ